MCTCDTHSNPTAGLLPVLGPVQLTTAAVAAGGGESHEPAQPSKWLLLATDSYTTNPLRQTTPVQNLLLCSSQHTAEIQIRPTNPLLQRRGVHRVALTFKGQHDGAHSCRWHHCAHCRCCCSAAHNVHRPATAEAAAAAAFSPYAACFFLSTLNS